MRRLVPFLLVLSCGPKAPLAASDGAAQWEGRWLVEWARPGGWKPFLFTGTLDVVEEHGSWTTTLTFAQQGEGVMTPIGADLSADTARLVFGTPKGDTLSLDLFRDGDLVHGGAIWKEPDGTVSIPWSVVDGAREWTTLVDPSVQTPWPVATPTEVGLDPDAVAALVREAQRTHTSGFVIVKDHKLVVAVGESLDAPAHVASVSKALSSLAVPYLIAEGRWPSVDTPLSQALSDWSSQDDPHREITLRHVLSHTTGLEIPEYAAWFDAAKHDHRADLLAAPLVSAPGTTFAYSNRAIELVPTLVGEVTGEPLDTYLAPRLLQPLEGDARWSHDGKGQPRAHAGVSIDAVDLVKIGVLLADDGVWEGQRVLPEGWAAQASTAATEASVGWGLGWRLYRSGFGHTGDSGAMLIVQPEKGIVAARVHRPTRSDERDRTAHYAVGKLETGVLTLETR